MQLLQVTALLIEGRGEESPVKCIERARGTKVTRHDDVYVAFLDIIKSDHFKTFMSLVSLGF